MDRFSNYSSEVHNVMMAELSANPAVVIESDPWLGLEDWTISDDDSAREAAIPAA